MAAAVGRALWSFRGGPVYRLRQKLAGERYFPRLHDMDEAVQDAQKRLLLARRRTQEHRADCHEPDLFDLVNSKRRVRELIEHLEKKFTLAAGQ